MFSNKLCPKCKLHYIFIDKLRRSPGCIQYILIQPNNEQPEKLYFRGNIRHVLSLETQVHLIFRSNFLRWNVLSPATSSCITMYLCIYYTQAHTHNAVLMYFFYTILSLKTSKKEMNICALFTNLKSHSELKYLTFFSVAWLPKLKSKVCPKWKYVYKNEYTYRDTIVCCMVFIRGRFCGFVLLQWMDMKYNLI